MVSIPIAHLVAYIAVTQVNGRLTVPVDILVADNDGVEISVVDTLDGEVEVVRQLHIQCQRSLPRLGHTQVFGQYGRTGRVAGASCGVNLVEHALLTGSQCGLHLAVGVGGHIGGLSHS